MLGLKLIHVSERGSLWCRQLKFFVKIFFVVFSIKWVNYFFKIPGASFIYHSALWFMFLNSPKGPYLLDIFVVGMPWWTWWFNLKITYHAVFIMFCGFGQNLTGSILSNLQYKMHQNPKLIYVSLLLLQLSLPNPLKPGVKLRMKM